MVGQEKLINSLNELIQNNKFPRTLLLVGEEGCGKHTLSSELSNIMNLTINDITELLSSELIDEIYLKPTPAIYLINSDDITIREQNMILKFIEEPLKNAYIFLLSTSTRKLLPTIINRCQPYYFEAYSEKELKSFLTDNIDQRVLELCTTPGMILQAQQQSSSEMYNLAESIFLNIHKASYSNALTLVNKFKYKKDDKEDKFDFDFFLKILIHVSVKYYENKYITFQEYTLVKELFSKCLIAHINKKYLFEQFIINLKRGKDVC